MGVHVKREKPYKVSRNRGNTGACTRRGSAFLRAAVQIICSRPVATMKSSGRRMVALVVGQNVRLGVPGSQVLLGFPARQHACSV